MLQQPRSHNASGVFLDSSLRQLWWHHGNASSARLINSVSVSRSEESIRSARRSRASSIQRTTQVRGEQALHALAA